MEVRKEELRQLEEQYASSALSPVDKFALLVDRIAPLRRLINTKQDPPPTTLAETKETALTEIKTIRVRILDLVPERQLTHWLGIERVAPEQYAREVTAFAQFSTDFLAGKIPVIGLAAVMNTPQQDKPAVAQQKIRQMLAPITSVTTAGSLRTYRRGFSITARRLESFLGYHSKDTLVQAIDGLALVERALFEESSSVQFLEDLDYLDLEDCNELRLAIHIRNAVFDTLKTRDEIVERLIVTASERTNTSLEPSIIMDLLLTLPYHRKVFQELMDAASVTDCQDQLAALFRSHPQTSRLAYLLENLARRGLSEESEQ